MGGSTTEYYYVDSSEAWDAVKLRLFLASGSGSNAELELFLNLKRGKLTYARTKLRFEQEWFVRASDLSDASPEWLQTGAGKYPDYPPARG